MVLALYEELLEARVIQWPFLDLHRDSFQAVWYPVLGRERTLVDFLGHSDDKTCPVRSVPVFVFDYAYACPMDIGLPPEHVLVLVAYRLGSLHVCPLSVSGASTRTAPGLGGRGNSAVSRVFYFRLPLKNWR